MEWIVEAATEPGVAARPAEIVERKGLGHPDTLCDALAEALGLALCRHDLEAHGAIRHHNVDKALLWAGRAEPRFGGGRVREPLEIFLAGRAAAAREAAFDLDALCHDVVHGWIRRHLRDLDPERHVRVHALVRPASVDLAALFARDDAGPAANDTSCGVGFAPLSPLETLVLAVERHLVSSAVRERHPAFGEDVKVMGLRRGARVHLTVACALVDRHVSDADDARAARAALEAESQACARAVCPLPVDVVVNAADDPGRGDFYLTVTGTSAEAGDDGQAGRGNRVNGLITPGRPMTLESVAGKNPVSHVGKLYNLAAGLTAQALVDAIPEVTEAEVRLVSRIGAPVDAPPLAWLRLRSGPPEAPRAPSRAVLDAAAALAREQVGRTSGLWRELVEGRIVPDGWPLRRPADPRGG